MSRGSLRAMWRRAYTAGCSEGNVGLKDRGVKKAPFVVLIGANMPSILAEISFVTNPKDANQLRSRIIGSAWRRVCTRAWRNMRVG